LTHVYFSFCAEANDRDKGPALPWLLVAGSYQLGVAQKNAGARRSLLIALLANSL